MIVLELLLGAILGAVFVSGTIYFAMRLKTPSLPQPQEGSRSQTVYGPRTGI
ncbi:hypothetical protein GGQ73_004384 [Rhizobium skierniewicense]|uniref:Uncharacterized protein n=1 Tax=Rhizobium skierniewicense TaxID=984260 RepID=A0A7W6G408_9HYPH|nr:hypothetical protein [Rhizobium skierniewicense]